MSKFKTSPRYKQGDNIGHLEILKTPGLDEYILTSTQREYIYQVRCSRTGDIREMRQPVLRRREIGEIQDYCESCRFITSKKRLEAEAKELEKNKGLTQQKVAQMRW